MYLIKIFDLILMNNLHECQNQTIEIKNILLILEKKKNPTVQTKNHTPNITK